MAGELKQKVTELVEGPLRAEGCELVELQLSQYKTATTVRLFVYCDHGPTLEECARLSGIIGNVIDGTDLFERGYTLEVSSPGLDRPLKTARDFRRRVGETVRIVFVDPKRKQITAEIVSASEEAVEFRDENESFSVPLAEIERAKIVL